jgi:hypothetical protein
MALAPGIDAALDLGLVLGVVPAHRMVAASSARQLPLLFALGASV